MAKRFSAGVIRDAMNTLFTAFVTTAILANNHLVNGQGCESFYATSTAGNPSDVSIATASYFTCTGDAFIVGVDVWFYSQIESVEWTCSSGEESNIFDEAGLADGSSSFSVGMTAVETSVENDSLPWLGNMYFGGYDLTYDETNVSFAWTGPFGDDSAGYLPDSTSSSCGSNAFAVGAIVWASSNFVYGIQLECAEITETCSPPNYPTSAIQDTDDSTTTLQNADDSAMPYQEGTDDGAISYQDTDGKRSWDTNEIIVVSILGGALCVVSILAGVVLCLCHRRQLRETPDTSRTQGAQNALAITGVPAPSHPSCPPPQYA